MRTVPLAGATTQPPGRGARPSARRCRAGRPARGRRRGRRGSSARRSRRRAAPRLARPASVPAGGSSMTPVTPSSRMVSMHRSQRTGLLTWPTRRAQHLARRRARPSPSRFESSRVRGSCVRDRARRSRPSVLDGRAPCARCGTRRRPAAGCSRALAGGSAAKRRELLQRAGGDDLAGAVDVGRGQAVLARCAAEHLVGVAAEDGGHAGRRDGARRRPSPGRARGPAPSPARRRCTPAPAAAVISPTLCPAPRRRRRNASAGCGKSSSGATRPAATSSGWATAVSRIVSASASVP